MPLFSNRWIWASVLLSLLLQAVLIYTPAYPLFKIVPLDGAELLSLLAGDLVFYGFFLIYQYGVVPVFSGNRAIDGLFVGRSLFFCLNYFIDQFPDLFPPCPC